MTKRQIKDWLNELREFAIQLSGTASAVRDTTPFMPSLIFSVEEHGGLLLSGEEAERYSEIVGGLAECLGDTMSKSSIAELVQTAILKTLDPKKKQQADSPSDRARRAVSE